MNPAEIERAIQDVFDGTADEATGYALAEVLKSDPAARELYYQHAELEQALTTRFSQGSAAETATVLANSRLRLQNRRRGIVAILSAAAVLMLSAVVLRLILTKAPERLYSFETAAGSLVSITGSNPHAKSNELTVGSTVQLDQGSIELTFGHGSHALILAPASFHVPSRDTLQLQRGTGWFRIDETTQGFKVVTPGLEVTDFGTEFGVVSEPDIPDQVHVFKGRVRAKNLKANDHEEDLIAGDSRVSDPAGKLVSTRSRPWDFLVRLPESASDGIIVNGGFESGETPPDSSFGVEATASNLPGWRFGHRIAVVRANSEGEPGYGTKRITILSSTGDKQVAFNAGGHGTPNPNLVRIYQTFTTEPGFEYEVNFEMGGIFFSENPVAVTASVHNGMGPGGPLLSEHTEQRKPSEGNGYNAPATFRFRATSANTTLVFTETSASSFRADPVIDNVSVRAVR
ncbi:MAG: DUF642 domain-containing protein [Luteolibacter sp.]